MRAEGHLHIAKPALGRRERIGVKFGARARKMIDEREEHQPRLVVRQAKRERHTKSLTACATGLTRTRGASDNDYAAYPLCFRCQRVFFSILRCLCFRIFLRRFFTTELIARLLVLRTVDARAQDRSASERNIRRR